MVRGHYRAARGFTLIELMIVIAIIAIIAAIAIPGLLSSQRASNERNASTSLKTLTSAQADFRANDRDGNKVNDFWTANVAGLYTMTSAAVIGNSNSTTDPVIKLIELSIASADADGTAIPAGGENTALTQFAVPSAKAGYWYHALISDGGTSGAEATYQQDTGGAVAMGSVHNYWKFGFTAWPESRSAGKFVFIIDENNTIFRSALSTNISPSLNVPPGPAAAPYNTYPSSADLKSYWSKLD